MNRILRTKGGVTSLLTLVMAGHLVLIGCVTGASESEVEAACRHLETLQSGQPAEEAQERLNKCKQDFAHLRITSTSAQCRAKATDLDHFWNRCR